MKRAKEKIAALEYHLIEAIKKSDTNSLKPSHTMIFYFLDHNEEIVTTEMYLIANKSGQWV
jgi:hypothetical protein